MRYNIATSKRKNDSGDACNIPLPDTRKGLLMHTYSTIQSSLFPNLDIEPFAQVATMERDAAPMPMLDFLRDHPQYRMSGILMIKEQARVHNQDELMLLPEILVPAYPFVSSKRGVRNLNQTLTHYQCKGCRRVLRNDLIRFNPSGTPVQCLECQNQSFKDRYADGLGDLLKVRRETTWKYLAPQCMGCKCVLHYAAMHMHHLRDKKALIGVMVSKLIQKPGAGIAQRLVDEANKCIPLCANCHALVHAGVINVDHCEPLEYDAATIVQLLDGGE